MIPIAAGARIWIATGHTDMRKGMQGLALLVQEGFGRDPFAGDVFVFRGRAGTLIKALWHDGIGLSLYAKRLDRGRFHLAFGGGWRSGADRSTDGLFAGGD
jgi:transposase